MASYILSMDSSVHADASAAESAITGAGGTIINTYSLPLTYKVDATAEEISAIAGVSYSELEATSLTATHAGSFNTLHLTYTSRDRGNNDLPNWNPSRTGSGTTVYLLDTGVDTAHNEFANATITNLHNASSVDGFGDTDGHGTSIASLIVGENIGVSKDATLKNVKLFNGSNGTISVGEVVGALDSVLTDHNNNTPGKAKVVCMPWVATKNQLIDQKIAELQDNNLLMVAAAGNGGTEVDNFSPGGLDTITTVGSLDLTNFNSPSVSSFTNMPLIDYVDANTTPVAKAPVTGAKVDVFAPGVNVSVADLSNVSNYLTVTGTSASAGIVAGAYCHWIEENPSDDARTLRSALIYEGYTHASAKGYPTAGQTEMSYADIDANGDYAPGKIVDFANVSYSMVKVPHTNDTRLTAEPQGMIATVQYGQSVSETININDSASNVALLDFAPLSPWMSFDIGTGSLVADTSNVSTAPASISPGLYNFAIKGDVNGRTRVVEFQVGVYNNNADELDGAPEYYYDTDSADYETVSYSTSFYSVQRFEKP